MVALSIEFFKGPFKV